VGPSRGREVEGKEEEGGQADSTNAPIRRSHTSRELRMLDISEHPPSKRLRRPTRGAEAVDNSCEATRKSNMICPITCGCQNSLLDIMEKTRVVSHTPPTTQRGREVPPPRGERGASPYPKGEPERRTGGRRGGASRTAQNKRLDGPTRAGNYAC